MSEVSAISFFCSFMHTDTNNADTLVAIFPDNLEVPHAGVILPTLASYSRIQFNPTAPPKNLELQLRDPDGSVISSNLVEPEVIAKAVQDGLLAKQPIVTLVLRMNAVGFPLHKIGRYCVWLIVDGAEKLCGILNVRTFGELPK